MKRLLVVKSKFSQCHEVPGLMGGVEEWVLGHVLGPSKFPVREEVSLSDAGNLNQLLLGP